MRFVLVRTGGISNETKRTQAKKLLLYKNAAITRAKLIIAASVCFRDALFNGLAAGRQLASQQSQPAEETHERQGRMGRFRSCRRLIEAGH